MFGGGPQQVEESGLPNLFGVSAVGGRQLAVIFCALIVLCLLSGCGWQTTLDAADGTPVTVTRATLRDLKDFADEEGHIPLERVLYQNGYRLVETLFASGAEVGVREFDWAEVAETAQWLKSGELSLGGETLTAEHLAVISSPEMAVPGKSAVSQS